MLLPELEFAALLAYTPRPENEEQRRSRTVMYHVIEDHLVLQPPRPMSAWVAQRVQEQLRSLPFQGFFGPYVTLVPAPKSSLMQPGTLWVPHRLAHALARAGLGKAVDACLERAAAVLKAALSEPERRPTAHQHYDSLRVTPGLATPTEILLVDDVVTSGATLLGAASRLRQAFPGARIRAFAALRTISNPVEFCGLVDACVGKIELLSNGKTMRRP